MTQVLGNLRGISDEDLSYTLRSTGSKKIVTLGSLFDGIGGWQLAAKRAGIKVLWSSEIEKFPLAVTKYHYPETIQLGDITKINVDEIEPVDIISASSPCTNLSVAGNRDGLEGAESRLFYESIRIVRRLRRITNGKYPKFFIWENVTGAFSSNRGNDFRTVLEEIAETEIPMPNSGRWAKAGMVRNGKCEIAWRVFDAQYWGVPQRRKRIYLVASFDYRLWGGASEILFDTCSLSWDTEEGREERHENTRITETSSGETVRNVITFSDKASTLRANAGMPKHSSDIVGRLVYQPDKVRLFENHGQDSRYKELPNVCMTVTETYGAGGNNTPFVVNESKKSVRKLTPLECERLQGLPDNYTLIDDLSCRDSARYRALGNGLAQPIPDWILKRVYAIMQKS